MPLQLSDILPEDRRSYDKMEPPKKEGKGVGSVSCLFRLLFRRQLDWMQQQQLDGFPRFRETDDRLLSRDGDEFGLDRREFHGKSISSKRIAGSRVVMWCGSFRWGGGIGPALAVIALRTVASAFRPRLFLMTMMNSLRDGASCPLKKKTAAYRSPHFRLLILLYNYNVVCCRRTRPTFSSRRRGRITGCGSRTTWRPTTDCCPPPGSTPCGGRTRSSRTQRKSPSRTSPSPTTTFGSTRTRASSTWSSTSPARFPPFFLIFQIVF